jgi:hypothetical protein
MPIKNYTTTKDVYTSVGEIQGALAKGGATKIMVDYVGGKPVAVTFALPGMNGQIRGFTLPAAVEGTLRVFQKQHVKADREQAEMTAWRNIHDWVMAQMALVESCDIPVDEVFLPYLTDGHGTTLYQIYQSGHLMLGDGGNYD